MAMTFKEYLEKGALYCPVCKKGLENADVGKPEVLGEAPPFIQVRIECAHCHAIFDEMYEMVGVHLFDEERDLDE